MGDNTVMLEATPTLSIGLAHPIGLSIAMTGFNLEGGATFLAPVQAAHLVAQVPMSTPADFGRASVFISGGVVPVIAEHGSLERGGEVRTLRVIAEAPLHGSSEWTLEHDLRYRNLTYRSGDERRDVTICMDEAGAITRLHVSDSAPGFADVGFGTGIKEGEVSSDLHLEVPTSSAISFFRKADRLFDSRVSDYSTERLNIALLFSALLYIFHNSNVGNEIECQNERGQTIGRVSLTAGIDRFVLRGAEDTIGAALGVFDRQKFPFDLAFQNERITFAIAGGLSLTFITEFEKFRIRQDVKGREFNPYLLQLCRFFQKVIETVRH
jgi:hypothetical protein